jgi:hypothetical protein
MVANPSWMLPQCLTELVQWKRACYQWLYNRQSAYFGHKIDLIDIINRGKCIRGEG